MQAADKQAVQAERAELPAADKQVAQAERAVPLEQAGLQAADKQAGPPVELQVVPREAGCHSCCKILLHLNLHCRN